MRTIPISTRTCGGTVRTTSTGRERHVDHEIIFGFGDHGIESRVIGNTSDELVEAVQEFMRREVARLLGGERGDTSPGGPHTV